MILVVFLLREKCILCLQNITYTAHIYQSLSFLYTQINIFTCKLQQQMHHQYQIPIDCYSSSCKYVSLELKEKKGNMSFWNRLLFPLSFPCSRWIFLFKWTKCNFFPCLLFFFFTTSGVMLFLIYFLFTPIIRVHSAIFSRSYFCMARYMW